MNKQEILLAQKEFLFPAVFHYFKEPLVVTHAKDQYVWDADGKQYLDFFGGIVTVSVGHCNDQVHRNDRNHRAAAFVSRPIVRRDGIVRPGAVETRPSPGWHRPCGERVLLPL